MCCGLRRQEITAPEAGPVLICVLRPRTSSFHFLPSNRSEFSYLDMEAALQHVMPLLKARTLELLTWGPYRFS